MCVGAAQKVRKCSFDRVIDPLHIKVNARCPKIGQRASMINGRNHRRGFPFDKDSNPKIRAHRSANGIVQF